MRKEIYFFFMIDTHLEGVSLSSSSWGHSCAIEWSSIWHVGSVICTFTGNAKNLQIFSDQKMKTCISAAVWTDWWCEILGAAWKFYSRIFRPTFQIIENCLRGIGAIFYSIKAARVHLTATSRSLPSCSPVIAVVGIFIFFQQYSGLIDLESSYVSLIICAHFFTPIWNVTKFCDRNCGQSKIFKFIGLGFYDQFVTNMGQFKYWKYLTKMNLSIKPFFNRLHWFEIYDFIKFFVKGIQPCNFNLRRVVSMICIPSTVNLNLGYICYSAKFLFCQFVKWDKSVYETRLGISK